MEARRTEPEVKGRGYSRSPLNLALKLTKTGTSYRNASLISARLKELVSRLQMSREKIGPGFIQRSIGRLTIDIGKRASFLLKSQDRQTRSFVPSDVVIMTEHHRPLSWNILL